MDTKTNNLQIMIRGRDLKLMRVHAEISTSVMAEYLGIKSRKTIGNWEAEQSAPSINQYILFCKFAGFHPGTVIEKIMERNASGNDHQDIDLSECS